MRPIDDFFLQKNEPVKGCLQFLRDLILNHDKNITEAWKYGMPFYCYKGKMFCYLWVHKKTHSPYIGIVEGRKIEHPLLVIEDRARMKIMQLNAGDDIPVETIKAILKMAIDIYSF
ncbi:DUF1801 domain-containing protein [Mucilaginibacter sp. BJC16-A38]|uniref:DUF1801 domain-containing protein n=1 Tax=Mucilaginibacter phenanthrenivorans TaxID=1234842 RepID=UPI002157296F|nr:DUF1801 domain-containing protein [Mucilaginibacter phenanthrenivorans]MCR8559466.1 DUF1801 domain-containing protein [Mucilaginibacter phenanthrenivorans]